VLRSRLGLKAKKILNARSKALEHLPFEESEARLAALEAGIEEVHEWPEAPGVPGMEDSPLPPPDVGEVPIAVRRLGEAEATVDSLPRFWDQVGVLYRDGETRELSPDPYLTTGAIPPLSSTFNDFSASREMFPLLNAGQCTG